MKNSKKGSTDIVVIVAMVIMGISALIYNACTPNDVEKREMAVKMSIDSAAQAEDLAFQKEKNKIALEGMRAGTVCVDTIVKIQTVRDTIRPTVDDMFGKYQKEICSVTLKIKKVSYSLDLTEQAKNEMNAEEIQIPVDRDFYEKVHAGTNLSDGGIRMGSLAFGGNISSWSMEIVGKECNKR